MNYSSGLSFADLESVEKKIGKRGVELCFTLGEIYVCLRKQ
jgi:hypothetical protein